MKKNVVAQSMHFLRGKATKILFERVPKNVFYKNIF